MQKIPFCSGFNSSEMMSGKFAHVTAVKLTLSLWTLKSNLVITRLIMTCFIMNFDMVLHRVVDNRLSLDQTKRGNTETTSYQLNRF